MSLAGHRAALDPHLGNLSDTEITFVDWLDKGIGLLWNLTSLVLNWLLGVSLDELCLVGYC